MDSQCHGEGVLSQRAAAGWGHLALPVRLSHITSDYLDPCPLVFRTGKMPLAVRAEDLQIEFDEAVLAYTMGDYAAAVKGFEAVLAVESEHFEARLSLGMAFYRQENFARAIEEGRKAEAMNADEQRVHTNLSLAYMRSGDKERAEHHGLQAKLAGWRGNMDAPEADGDDLKMAEPKPENVKLPTKFPDMPWKKKD